MIFDLHNDVLTANLTSNILSDTLTSYSSCPDIFKATLAIWTTKTPLPLNSILKLFSVANKLNHGNKFLYAIEDLHFIDYSCIDFLFFLKEKFNVIYAGLTWNFENPLAGGSLSDARLSSLGKDVLIALEDANILIDTAHLNKNSFWDVINHSSKPVINSHCCFNSIHSHPRNLDDDQINAIIQRDGIVALTLVPDFLSKNPAKLVDSFNHIDYFISMFGFKNLAFGSDFFGSSSYPEGLESYSDFSKLASLMKSHGYPDEVIDAIFFKNAERVIAKQLIG